MAMNKILFFVDISTLFFTNLALNKRAKLLIIRRKARNALLIGDNQHVIVIFLYINGSKPQCVNFAEGSVNQAFFIKES